MKSLDGAVSEKEVPPFFSGPSMNRGGTINLLVLGSPNSVQWNIICIATDRSQLVVGVLTTMAEVMYNQWSLPRQHMIQGSHGFFESGQ